MYARTIYRARCWSALLLFKIAASITGLSASAAPKNHPWRTLVTSARKSLAPTASIVLAPTTVEGTKSIKVAPKKRGVLIVLGGGVAVAARVAYEPALLATLF